MGTYTTNYNLFLPTVGEQGWGELVNGNFSTIDTTMKGLDTWMETLETEGDAVAARVTAIEEVVSNGGVNADKVHGNLSVDRITAGKIVIPLNTNGSIIVDTISHSFNVRDTTSTYTYHLNDSGIFEYTGTYDVNFTGCYKKYDTGTVKLQVYVDDVLKLNKTVTTTGTSYGPISVPVHSTLKVTLTVDNSQAFTTVKGTIKF